MFKIKVETLDIRIYLFDTALTIHKYTKKYKLQ